MQALRLAFWRKPLHLETLSHSVQEPKDAPELERTLGLFDLLMIGIGGTVGSGVFATSGLIASSYAGPAATLSWLLAGAGCLLSGLSFMELSCLIPSAGSSYAYAYHALGELPALIAGFLLTLEYGVSSAGAARSWSEKLTHWMETQLGVQGPDWMKPQDSVLDVYAGLLTASSTAVVLCGMQAGKVVINVVTMTKIAVVVFIIVMGLANFRFDRILPFVPESRVVDVHGKEQVAFGWSGVLLGASASFFGYIGYDEVCCLAGEAKHPTRNIPRAVVGTILGAATLSILATLALVGMQEYTDINDKESYGNAFTSIGLDWAATFVVTGEVLTMPITAFISFLAQPRVQYAMAKDGLLPATFAQLDVNGTLFRGTLLSGIGVTLLAMFVPFHVLWNIISLGILVAFNITNSSLLLVRLSTACLYTTNDKPLVQSHGAMVVAYLVSSFMAAYHWQKGVIATVPVNAMTEWPIFDGYMRAFGPFVAAFFTVVAIALVFALRDAEIKATVALAAETAAQSQRCETVLNSKTQLILNDANRQICSLDREDNDTDSDNENDGQGEQLHVQEKKSSSKNDTSKSLDDIDDIKLDESTFRAPLVPFTPCVAIFFNWFLFAQMDGMSILLILLWLLLAVVVYFSYSRFHSLAFQQTQYHQLEQQ
ncbi:hypothetical protein CCR75_003828 [Bremia lactucae]|uniref:Cationic amino acid transporter C-terminal domain-containing protein n=1 Tax=Bremia lactucae TaxID=4779 RepID=A0A976FKF6_BRELC|nr:hypothetical protein CCR75_003828 [Bremia lactucae]